MKTSAIHHMQRGFTIVELLIVIVIIGILASITVVAYAGITNNSKTSSAQSAATAAIKKIGLASVDLAGYPGTSSVLTGAATSASYYLPGVTFDATALSTSNLPVLPSELNFYKCGTGATTTAPANLAAITTQTGVRVDYWNYGSSAVVSMFSGVTSGLVGTYNVACYITT